MSEQILKALMELFAIIARPEGNGNDRRSVVKSFLMRQLNQELVNDYLDVFDAYFSKHQALQIERGERRIGPDSVKILRICNDINKELTQKQKFIVLVQLFEFAKADKHKISDQELEFIEVVTDSFYITREEQNLLKEFTTNTFDNIPEYPDLLVINNKKGPVRNICKYMYSEFLDGYLWIIHIATANMYFLRYIGENEMYLNGQILQQDKVYVLNSGMSIRNHLIKPLYFSDVVNKFKEDQEQQRIVFEANSISYRFKSGKTGLHPMSFIEESGRLIGIMGASGAGKSTLLNILNGSNAPTTGEVLINGNNIHTEKEKSKGLIGHVSQDDLLIEELTVFENLYYNAKLCFDCYSRQELTEAVTNMLNSLGLYEIKDIQVGTPLNKKISGGQRKRLNIALELIREPAVLFLDEPTSGLSSRDSENIMDLLKDLTLKGKLVFVVIHQPSSDIFKMLDNLLFLDTGGYLIYSGNPIDSIMYFKSRVHHANWSESECHVCGNVNPEQIFNIVESLVIDEYGKETHTRKISPREWNRIYNESKKTEEQTIKPSAELPSVFFKVPNKLKQFLVFVKRDILAKLANTQYLVITFLEAPLLALILSYIIKYYNVSETEANTYSFIENSNLPVYLFMSVIIAIFMGLTLSSEEIIKDRKILKREAFLNLSWASYLFSKAAVMFAISAVQALTFVFVGNSIMEIKGMYFQYWVLLFSAWASSNIMGLLISDSFKTVVTIYILIPFLVIPQIMLSGVMVKYEKLNPKISSPSKIPWYGEMMTARWGYEALAVNQFMKNNYDKIFYRENRVMSLAEYKKNYWIKNLENKVDFLQKNYNENGQEARKGNALTLLQNELSKEMLILKSLNNRAIQNFDYSFINNLNPESVNLPTLLKTDSLIHLINRVYIKIYNEANDRRDNLIREMQSTPEGKELFHRIKRDYHNDELTEFVENNNEIVRIIEYKGRLYQKIDPIYMVPENNFIKAHFYAPYKRFFGNLYETFWVNTIVIWTFSILLFIILYFRGLKIVLDFFEQVSERLKRNTEE
ncbi:MAG: ATP-binding cassette domain-containing protein [Bacteroidales bacterium]|nr:ATP-binding cassette domain-containing protein [Bacteroidales bacterium]